ncbi:hypothetical protein SLNSH_21845 [Alsobacter soli]|uniref:Uncharacterized protein n=1 Tax=Alsobacter soli TaxID=2109933 RepID=A0A2T1HMG6_9HYPH|nr:hypothetical protein [Alsobacter soli]PSC02844.1 hypothetical protein SLNSH_21845 [Alsobacter soli]
MWANWLLTQPGTCRHYLVTLTFDRYHDRRFALDAPADLLPDRVVKADVLAGATRKLSPEEAVKAMCSDVQRWYLRVLSDLLGGRYADYPELQPRTVGWIDEPAVKHASAGRAARMPGEEFPHVHFVMAVREDVAPRGLALADAFEVAHRDGRLAIHWHRLNAAGGLHLTEAYDVPGALDYASKTAKRNAAYREHMLLLPFATPGRPDADQRH